MSVIEGVAIYPLDYFYELQQAAMPDIRQISGDEMPNPYRYLLVHEGDMTPRLQKYHQQPLHLKVIEKHLTDQDLRRMVLLMTPDEKVVEFGAIRIHLNNLPDDARRDVEGCYHPLGGILGNYGIGHRGEIQGFFQVWSDSVIGAAMNLSDAYLLYGRMNRLVDDSGKSIADVVEILPPV